MAPFSADSLSALRRKHRFPLVLELPSGRYRANRGPAWQREPTFHGVVYWAIVINASHCRSLTLALACKLDDHAITKAPTDPVRCHFERSSDDRRCSC